MTSQKQVLICDQCGAENWNLASEGQSHDQEANSRSKAMKLVTASGVFPIPVEIANDQVR